MSEFEDKFRNDRELLEKQALDDEYREYVKSQKRHGSETEAPGAIKKVRTKNTQQTSQPFFCSGNRAKAMKCSS